MAFRKTPEQKAADQAARAREQKEAADDRARQEYLSSPAGQAAQAKERGDRFFEIQLFVATSARTSLGMNTPVHATTTTQSSAHHLAAIEDVGWRLEHVGYTFMETSEEVTVKNLRVGENVGVSGVIVGVYLFRSTD